MNDEAKVSSTGLLEGSRVIVTDKHGNNYRSLLISANEAQDMMGQVCNAIERIEHGDGAWLRLTHDCVISVSAIGSVEIIPARTLDGKFISTYQCEFYKEHGRLPTKMESMSSLMKEVMDNLIGAPDDEPDEKEEEDHADDL